MNTNCGYLKDEARETLRLLLDYYHEELKLFWVRTNVFLILNVGAVSLTLQALLKEGKGEWLLFLPCFLGLTVSFLWFKANVDWVWSWRRWGRDARNVAMQCVHSKRILSNSLFWNYKPKEYGQQDNIQLTDSYLRRLLTPVCKYVGDWLVRYLLKTDYKNDEGVVADEDISWWRNPCGYYVYKRRPRMLASAQCMQWVVVLFFVGWCILTTGAFFKVTGNVMQASADEPSSTYNFNELWWYYGDSRFRVDSVLAPETIENPSADSP